MYAIDKISGKIIELTKNCVNLHLGKTIISSQNGKTPKLPHRYMFSNVK